MDLRALEGKKVMVTGATGLIGKAIIEEILAWNRFAKEPISILAVVRNEEKAKYVFANQSDYMEFLVGDIRQMKPVKKNVEYIIHGASQTASKAFIDEPVETIMTAIDGTRNVLEFARVNPIKSLVYLSSMEVYGTPLTDDKVFETHGTNLDVMKVRSCYPESKRMCECLCASYVAEYGVPARIVRLTQTFGPGVEYNDGRVFAEFARCAIEGRNIVLNTKGETKRSYLYTEDAVQAILAVMLHGTDGEAYNAANEETYCSIYEMACMVAETCSTKNITVECIENKNVTQFGYAPTLKMNLDTEKIQELGWHPQTDLQHMFQYMIDCMKK